MRIVSLLAACTEWVAALGAQDLLVGRSHECDFPASLEKLPVLTRPLAPDGTSAEIDAAVRSRLHEGLSLYEVDLELLRQLEPDLVLTQTQCDVCAVSRTALEEDLASVFAHPPDLFSFEPSTFKGVLDGVLTLGRRIGRMKEAMAALAEREKRLKRFREELGLLRTTSAHDVPTVLCVEWIEPLMIAGHWMPDLVEMAGGRAVCVDAGASSQTVDWNRVLEKDPDVITVMPCGFAVERSRQEMPQLAARPGWSELSAVRRGNVLLLDGRSYFNRPGPRLYRSVELLGAALHGSRAGIDAARWEMQPFKAEKKLVE